MLDGPLSCKQCSSGARPPGGRPAGGRPEDTGRPKAGRPVAGPPDWRLAGREAGRPVTVPEARSSRRTGGRPPAGTACDVQDPGGGG
jgi:hypothetical protein